MNVIYYRNATESASVPHYYISVERALDVYEELVPNVKMKPCEQAGKILQAEIILFILKMKNWGKITDNCSKLNLQNISRFKKNSRQQVTVFSCFFLIQISTHHSVERKLEKQETTYCSYFSVVGSVGFLLSTIHFTERELLLMQLLTKPGKYFDDACILYSTALSLYQYEVT